MEISEAEKLVGTAKELGLAGADFVASLGVEKVAVACNGIGPAKWPEKWRGKFDKWLWLFRPAADIHDCRFTYDNDGSKAKFRAANVEFEANCHILADEEYAWYNPLRYLWRHRAKVAGWACREFGWDAWIEAFKEGPQRTEETGEGEIRTTVSPALCG